MSLTPPTFFNGLRNIVNQPIVPFVPSVFCKRSLLRHLFFLNLSISSTDTLIGLKNSSSISFLIPVSLYLNSLFFNSLKCFSGSKRLFLTSRILFSYYCRSIPSQYVFFYSFVVSNDPCLYIIKIIFRRFLKKNYSNSIRTV